MGRMMTKCTNRDYLCLEREPPSSPSSSPSLAFKIFWNSWFVNQMLVGDQFLCGLSADEVKEFVSSKVSVGV
jgi:hypothetical protein